MEACGGCVEGGGADAVVGGDAVDDDVGDVGFAEEGFHACGGTAIVFEAGVGVVAFVFAFLDDGGEEIAVEEEVSAWGFADAVWGPEDLGAAVEGDGFEGFAVLVIGEEGDVIGWVPVLGGVDGEACGFEGGGGGGDGGEVGGVGAGDGERAFVGFGEVGLNVDDDDGGFGSGGLGSLGSRGRGGGSGDREEGEKGEERAARGHGMERYNKWRVGAMSVGAWGKEVALVWERGEMLG